MKIAVVGINYYPELTGIGVYTTDMCEHLVSKGHDITVFTSFPYYPFGADYSSWYADKHVRRSAASFCENINGAKIIRCNLYKPKKPGTLGRMIHEATFIKSIFFRTFFSKDVFDMVICISPPFLLGLVATMLSKRKNAPLLLHVQDLQIDAAKELGMIKNRVLLSLLESIERYIYKKVNFVTTISSAMKEKILEKGADKEKVDLLVNWADPETILPLDRNNSFSRRHNLDDKFVVLHAGNMGEKQDIHMILNAARAMKGEQEVRFLLIGRGGKRPAAERYVRRHALTNVLILDIQSRGTLAEMFSACDVALIAQDKNIRNCVMPSKVFGPACAAKPMIIAAHESCEICALAHAHNFGMVIPPGDTTALVAAIYQLKNNTAQAEKLGKNGRHFMVQYRHLEKILDLFENTVITRYAAGRQP